MTQTNRSGLNLKSRRKYYELPKKEKVTFRDARVREVNEGTGKSLASRRVEESNQLKV